MLENKLVLITGSSQGLGAAIARRFAESRCRLVITWNKALDAAMKTAAECEQAGAIEVMVMKLDVSSRESVEQAIADVVKRFGRIDVLINNSGILTHKPLAEQTTEEIDSQIQTNLRGVILVTKASLPYLQECIINIGSNAALAGEKRETVYSAAKFAVRGFTQALARECPNLKIYVVNPGLVATRMTGFKGVAPQRIAEIVWNAAAGRYQVASGQDINTRDYLDRSVRGRIVRFIKAKIRKFFRL